MSTWLYAFTSVAVVSLLSLVGVFTLSIKEKYIRKTILYLVSFAVGALFGDALIHLLPEAFENISSSFTVSLLVLSGIVIFFVLEKFVYWRHCHIVESGKHYHPVVAMNLVGDFIHNFLDGIIIGASYVVSLPLGLATTIAVVLHEIPQEIGDFVVLIYGGVKKYKALFLNFVSAAVAVLGGLVGFFLFQKMGEGILFLLPFTAGSFIYIAASDLIPQIKETYSFTKSMTYGNVHTHFALFW